MREAAAHTDAPAGRIRPFGDTGLLVEVPVDLDATDALRAVVSLRERWERSLAAQSDISLREGVTDLVPAARTVLVRFDPQRVPPSAVRAWLDRDLADPLDPLRRGAAIPTRVAPAEPDVEIGIRYDGPDLRETADLLGIPPERLVSAHLAATWTVAFTGFAPGFGYLVSEDWPFDVPRLPSPRTRVPAGSVGVAGVFSGAYPRSTPGGWRLIGSTSAPLFDPDAVSPALLRPGMRVRFREEGDLSDAGGVLGRDRREGGDVVRGRHERARLPHDTGAARGREAPRARSAPVLRVASPGLLTTIQDAGRLGAASLGVSVSGALDRGALRTANRLVGNEESAAALEITAGGFEADARADAWIAVTGAWGVLSVDGREIDHGVAHRWRRGERLRVDWFSAGARAYLAIRGGLEAPRVLGSAAADTLAGLGPAPLRTGDLLTLASAQAGEVPPSDLAPWSPPPSEIEVRLVPGPRTDAFTDASVEMLFEVAWRVGAAADRVGIRLDGPALERANTAELASEGMVPGAIQVPPDGSPTILLADGPVTGGYPVIATVLSGDLDLLGQAGPGTGVRFRHARTR